MSVPKTSVDEYDFLVTRKDYVRLARKSFLVKSKTISQGVNNLSN
jgi:hypothetical protein